VERQEARILLLEKQISSSDKTQQVRTNLLFRSAESTRTILSPNENQDRHVQRGES
jgi:hypothetical protein